MMTLQDLHNAAKAAKLDISACAEAYLRDINQMMAEMELDLLLELPPPEGPYPIDITISNIFLDDIVIPSMPREEILKNAPFTEAGCVSIPKMNMNRGA